MAGGGFEGKGPIPDPRRSGKQLWGAARIRYAVAAPESKDMGMPERGDSKDVLAGFGTGGDGVDGAIAGARRGSIEDRRRAMNSGKAQGNAMALGYA